MIYIYFTINICFAIYSYDQDRSILKSIIHLFAAIPIILLFIIYVFIMIFYYKLNNDAESYYYFVKNNGKIKPNHK